MTVGILGWPSLKEIALSIGNAGFFCVSVLPWKIAREGRASRGAGFCESPRFEGSASKNGHLQKNDRPGSRITHAKQSVRLRTRPVGDAIRTIRRVGQLCGSAGNSRTRLKEGAHQKWFHNEVIDKMANDLAGG